MAWKKGIGMKKDVCSNLNCITIIIIITEDFYAQMYSLFFCNK